MICHFAAASFAATSGVSEKIVGAMSSAAFLKKAGCPKLLAGWLRIAFFGPGGFLSSQLEENL